MYVLSATTQCFTKDWPYTYDYYGYQGLHGKEIETQLDST